MWKKALWIYLILYVLGLIGGIIYTSVIDVRSGEFIWVSMILPLVMLIPAGVVYFELRGKRVFILITLLAILITVVPLLGIFRFNDFNLATIGKALLFLPMLIALIYFGYNRVFRKK